MTFVKNNDKELENLKDLTLLDDDLNIAVQEYVKNIRDIDEVMGVKTNVNGRLDSTQKMQNPTSGRTLVQQIFYHKHHIDKRHD